MHSSIENHHHHPTVPHMEHVGRLIDWQRPQVAQLMTDRFIGDTTIVFFQIDINFAINSSYT